MRVRGVHFQSVFARRERRERQEPLDGDLLAGLLHVRRAFLELHSWYGFVAPLDRECKIRVGLVRRVVGLQVINLHVDAKPLIAGESPSSRGRTLEEPSTNWPVPISLAGTCSIWSARISELAASLSSS